MITGTGLERDILILACAVSAGIHAPLAPEHFAEGVAPGLGFLAAAVMLAGLVVTLTCRPRSAAAVVAAGVVLFGLIASYALATTAGVPVIHPDAEPVDGLGLATKAIEAAGLLAAVTHLLPKGRLTWTLARIVQFPSR